EQVVDVLPDHRDPREAATHGEHHGLAKRLVRLDPDHIGPGHHDLAHDRVAEREDRVDHVALTMLDHAALLRQVYELAQLDGGGERTLGVAPPGSHRVAEEDEQPRERVEHAAEPPPRRPDHPP